MALTYWGKAIFLAVSWGILFNGLDAPVINSTIFFTSVLIYTGAIIFDLIFLAIESTSKSDEKLNGISKLSKVLIFFNSFIALIELIGAMNGLCINKNPKNVLSISLMPSGLTTVFTPLKEYFLELWIFMILVLLFGILSILPGALSLKNKNRIKGN